MEANISQWFTAVWFIAFLLTFCDSNDISQMSPKSRSLKDEFEPQILETLSPSEYKQFQMDPSISAHDRLMKISEELEIHSRVERSALPILNEISSKPSLDYDKLKDLDSNDVDPAGRYFNYISPTKTFDKASENGEITNNQRMAKDLTDDSFLVKGGPRSLPSGSPISPTSVSLISQTAPSVNPNHPRQNPNPDIQDIITGIVKLLNGNVNVHANTQIHRRPVASRINNRGPPRISEAQPLPNDYDHQIPGSSMRPPPYPFDRPEGPVRPFLNGVPIPEQIVPSMQQNYRPGFISQNRPPWHRPRPRPPINGNRRPMPPYKPIPPLHEYHPEEEIQFTTIEADNNETIDINPTDFTPEHELSNEDSDEEYPTLTTSTESSPDVISNSEVPIKKVDHSKKKDTKNKSSDKKAIIPITQTTESDDMTTIIHSTSVVNTAQVVVSTKLHDTLNEPQEPTFESESDLETSIQDLEPMSAGNIKETPTITSTSSQTKEIVMSVEPSISSEQIEPTMEINNTEINPTQASIQTSSTENYHPRPGIVLDDPEFKPGGGGIPRPVQRPQRPQLQPTRPLPPGYGEIFDVTLSAIQGPGSGSGSQQTVKIKPYGSYGITGNGDIIVSPSGEEGFVSIDGKRTYINLFGESTDTAPPSTTIPTISSSQLPLTPGIQGTGYAVPESEITSQPNKPIKPLIHSTQQPPSQRPHYRPRTTQPPVRIDTCIVGDDSTCDKAQNERCKTENGVSSCHCRPGFSRRKHREPCRRVVSFLMSLRVDRIYERRIVWDKLLVDHTSEPYGQLSYESMRAIDSAMSMTPYSDEFMEAKVNNIYRGDASQGAAGVFVNLTLKLEENAETLRPNLRGDIQKHLLGVIHRRNNNIGNSVLYVESPPGSISNLQDLDECQFKDLNDCHIDAVCMNIWGSFRCECDKGYRDPWYDQPQRAGRECQSCPESHCNNRGTCSYDNDGGQVCTCEGSYYGAQCEIDGEVLGVAIGASVAAVIIIVLTLVCLIMWSRRWHREQKNAIGSPVFGYMATAPVKTGTMGQTPYQVTLEDRMRWAQIADVMAQANHYAAEPVATTRPSSAMFGYPNLQAMNLGTLGGMSMAGTLPMHHQGAMPPIPLPRRLGISSRSNGMRTLENSSSSEEEDRTDLLGRNFQVPRPKSRSNGSIANQSGIYYDVDYEPSGGELYGTTQSISNPIPGPQGIPMSTYTSGRAPSTYYMK